MPPVGYRTPSATSRTGWASCASPNCPAAVFAVAHRGELAHERAYGVADIGTGEPLTPRHRFRVASHSKTFTSAGVMKLREQRRLKLDDAVGQHVKGLHPGIASATIAQLLSHTAGIFRDGTDCA